MDERCYFAKEAPEVEIRGGLVFIKPAGSHCEIAVTPHVMRMFVRRASQMLDQFDREGRVVPLERRA